MNGLNMGLPLQTYIKKTVCVVETHLISCKENVLGTAASKEGHADSDIKTLITIDFLEKKSNSKQCFILLNPWAKFPLFVGGCPLGVMVKAMDCGIIISEFVLQSCYYIHFWANTLGKGMNPLLLPAMG